MGKLSNFFAKIDPSRIFTMGDNRKEVKLAKINYKKHNSDNKYAYKAHNSDNKYAAQTVAYQNGIDPKKSTWDGISNITGSVSDAVSSIYGFGFSPGQRPEDAYKGTGIFGTQSNNNIFYIIIGLVVLYFLVGSNPNKSNKNYAR